MTTLAATTALGPEWLQPDSILERFGPWALVAVLVILFVECGLLMFFLPGDSLLFVTGLFLATGKMHAPWWVAVPLMCVAAVGGNLVGYWLGRRVGPPLFERPNSRLVRPEHVQKTHDFFEKYGARSIILARFVPIVRTFITALAGIARMDYGKYARYSTVGGVGWVVLITALGYLLGQRFPALTERIELIAIVIVALSVIPIVVEVVKARREHTTLAEAVEETLASED